MDCELVFSRLPNFHFGAVERAEREELEHHLASCPSCLREWFGFKAAVEEGERLDVAPSPWVRAALFTHRLSSSPGFRRTAMAAALLLSLVGGVEWLRHAKAPAPPTATTVGLDTADTGEARNPTYHLF